MSVINTNYLALVSQNNLTKSQNSLGTAIERLSSGLRINSAKDDAAGQAIANRFTANIKGLTQASRNANDGISIAQTTEGALNEINNNLQRIRELSVQAANGSNSQSDLDSIQAEIQQRLGEIDRVSEQTQFNSVRVLAGDRESLTIQVGAQDNETISINLSKIDAESLGLGSFNISQPKLDVNSVGKAVTELQAADTTGFALYGNDTNPDPTWAIYVDDADANTLYVSSDGGTTYYEVTGYDQLSGKLEFSSETAATSVTASAVTAGQQIAVGDNITVDSDSVGFADSNPAAEETFYVDTDGQFFVKVGSNVYEGTLDATTGEVEYDSDAANLVASGVPATASEVLTTVQDPTGGVAPVTPDLTAVTGKLGADASLHAVTGGEHDYVVKGKIDGKEVYFAADVDEDGVVTLKNDPDTGEAIQFNTELKPLDALDKALQQVDNLRSDLGAIQNRFQSTIANLSNTVNNLSAARSRIEDADYAVEVSNMTRAQILQQAGTSVLAQANQVPQTVLSLLR